MNCKQIAVVVFILALVAPSIQYGTIFTDRITPALADSTYFSGLKTEEVFTTDAGIGRIVADNKLGFSINTPGFINSNSNSLSFVASQGIDFSSNGETNLVSSGQINLSGSTGALGVTNLDFVGNGDILFGGLRSIVRGNTFALNSVGDTSLVATGDELLIKAPQEILFSSVNDTNVLANNNIELISLYETNINANDITLRANYIQNDGSAEFYATNINTTITAGSIVEINSASGINATIYENYEITADAGDIHVSAPELLSFTGTPTDLSEFEFSGKNNLFIVNRATTESTIDLDVTGSLTLTATNQINFANFFGESDWSLDASGNTTFTAPSISFTTARGQFVAGDQLTLSSSGDFTVNVPSEDLYANAIQGGITLTAQQGRFVGFTRDLLSITANDIISDTVGSTTYASATGDVLFRQSNPESDGTLSVVIEAGLLANSSNVALTSAGKTAVNTVNGTLAIRAREASIGSGIVGPSRYGYPRQVTFDADRNVTITADAFRVLNWIDVPIVTGDYQLNAGAIQSIAKNSLEYTSGGDTSFIGGITFMSGKTISLVGTSSDSDIDITVGSGGYTQFVYATENRHSSVDITADLLSYTASSRFSTVSNEASITASAYNDAARVVQFLVGEYTDSADVLTITAGEAVYLGQNLPDDTLNVNGNLVINGQVASIQAGGNVIIDSDDFINFSGLGLLSITGTREFNLNSGTITIAPNAETSFLSGGALTVNVNDQFLVLTENDINVQGPNGENGQVTFSAGGAVTWDADRWLVNSTAINWESSSLTVEADTLRFLGTEGEDAFSSFRVLTLGGPIEVYADEHLTIQSRLGIYHADNEVVIDTTEYLDIVAQQLEVHAPDQISVNAFNFEILGGFSPPPQGFTNDNARLVWLGDDLVTQVDNTLDIDAGDHISFASGNNLAFNIVQDVLITSGDQLFIDASALANIESTDLQVTSADGELNLLSGGAFTLTTLGSVSATSDLNHQWESYTLNALVQGDSTFTATAATVRMVARDGMVSVQSSNTHDSTSGTNTQYTAAGSVLVKASTTVSTVDNGGDITIDTIKDGGDIIFDSEGGNEVIDATGDITHTTQGFTNYKTAQSIRFTSGALTTTTVADSFDWKAVNDVAITAVDLSMIIGGDAHKEVGGSVSINSQNDFLLTTGNNFLASTGEQGTLGIFSGAPSNFIATTFQRWRASGDFTWAAEDLSVTSTSQDISMFTTGGAVSYTGTDYSFTTVEDLVYRSGDYLRFASGTTGAWTATTTVQTLSTAGNVILDASAGLLLLKATNDIDITSGASRDPQDGIRVEAGSLAVTAGTSFNLLPTNFLNFGGETTPTFFQINAAGSATVTGVSINSEGNIMTKSDTTSYTAGVDFGANVRSYIGYAADDLLTFTTGILTVTSDAGSFHNHVNSLEWNVISPTGTLTSTSNTGVTEFISRNRVTEEDEILNFNSDDTMTVIANSLVYNIGEEYNSDTLTTVNTVTNNALFGTTMGGQGDLSFQSSNINIQSKGSIRGNVLGADGTLQFSSAALTVETRQSGDVIIRSAGGYYGYATEAANFVSNTQFTIESLSIDDGNDFTNGDVVVRANDITLSSGDTFTVTSQANVVTYATGDITDTAVTGLSFNSYDDTIFTASGMRLSATEDIRTDTVLGNDGNLVFTATGANPATSISFTLDDSIFNFNGNVLGQVDTTFQFNTNDGPLAITTSASNGDIRFEQRDSESSMTTSGTTLNVDLTGTFSTYSYLDAGFVSQTGTLNFTAYSGQTVFNTTQGNVIATIVGPSTFTSSEGQIKVEANGISPRSDFGIEVLGATTAFAAVNGTVTVNAYEAVELRAASEIYIGAQINTGDNTLPEEGGQTLTRFISRGHNADIVYNTREPLDGNGIFQIAALGNLEAATPAQFVQDRGNNDFVADANIQFEFESGLSFNGLFKTPSNNQLQSDVYFYANQDSVTVETTNTDANIVFRTSVTLFDADERLSIIGNGESGSTINFNSDEGGVFVRSQSTNRNDGISVHSYNGRITLDAKPDGSLLFVGQNNVRVVGEKGVTINTGFTSAVARNNLSFRASSGHVNIRGLTNTFTATTINIGQALSSAFGNNQTAHTGDVFFNSRNVLFNGNFVEWSTQTGNIDIEFGSFFDMRGSNVATFRQNPSLAVPMKQETITPGTLCSRRGEFAIAHNSFLASDAFAQGNNYITNTKDTGAMICLCTPRTNGDAWYCRAMSQAYPFE